MVESLVKPWQELWRWERGQEGGWKGGWAMDEKLRMSGRNGPTTTITKRTGSSKPHLSKIEQVRDKYLRINVSTFMVSQIKNKRFTFAQFFGLFLFLGRFAFNIFKNKFDLIWSVLIGFFSSPLSFILISHGLQFRNCFLSSWKAKNENFVQLQCKN